MFEKAIDSLGEALASGKSVLRILAALAILILVLWQCSLTHTLMVRALAPAELRHDVLNNAAYVEGDETEAVVFVENGGGRPASNVTIQVKAPPDTVNDYRISSAELVKVKRADLAAGDLFLSLERLAAGARVQINLEMDRSGLAGLSAAASSDQGASRPMEEPTTLGRLSEVADGVVAVVAGAGSVVWDNGPVKAVRDAFAETELGDYVTSPAFLAAGLTALAAIVLIFLFLPEHLWIVVAVIVGYFVWIFLDFQVPVWLIIGIVGLILVSFVLLDDDFDAGEKAVGVAAVVFFGAMCTWWQSGNSLGVGFFLGLAAFFGVGYLLER